VAEDRFPPPGRWVRRQAARSPLLKPRPPDDSTDWVDTIVDELFAPLKADRRLAVDLTADAFFTNDQRWPTFQHVELRLEENGSRCPGSYRLVPNRRYIGSIRRLSKRSTRREPERRQSRRASPADQAQPVRSNAPSISMILSFF
jgi:hypothetical protein